MRHAANVEWRNAPAEAGSEDRRVCGPRVFLSNSRPFIRWWQHAIDDQSAALILFFGSHAGVLVEARPAPVLRAARQAASSLSFQPLFLHHRALASATREREPADRNDGGLRYSLLLVSRAGELPWSKIPRRTMHRRGYQLPKRETLSPPAAQALAACGCSVQIKGPQSQAPGTQSCADSGVTLQRGLKLPHRAAARKLLKM